MDFFLPDELFLRDNHFTKLWSVSDPPLLFSSRLSLMSRILLIPKEGIHVILWVLRLKKAGFADKHSAPLC